ncbi:MFS monocarboxylate transporter [Fusarium circinatum]|uniref:MFS monocarboxylate transporter n=1 Tax=Fusarium circinatum TaxID=48490 RepID=A0A8H5X1M6_FUSCI|nr:MFS monocarboxylate transporter [Fusarium circinatum]
MGSASNTTTASVIELAPISQDQVFHENDRSMAGDIYPSEPTTQSQSLKPADGGLAAWTVLVTGFIFEAMFWGFPMAFGVFQNYYSQQPEFKNDKSKIAAIGTLAPSLFYLGAPLSALATKRYPKFRRQQIWLSWPLCILGLLTASFARSASELIATQGFLYGFGFVTFTYPIVAMLNDWWVARKGMAFGLISASSGATGAAILLSSSPC